MPGVRGTRMPGMRRPERRSAGSDTVLTEYLVSSIKFIYICFLYIMHYVNMVIHLHAWPKSFSLFSDRLTLGPTYP